MSVGASLPLRVERPAPHPGQERVLAEAQRFNVLRCGRRWGKSTLGERLAIDTSLQRHMPVGWIAPTYKYLDEAWRSLKRTLEPVASRVSEQDHRLELLGGGSIEFWSLDNNEDPARGRKYGRIIVDEAGICIKLEPAWLGALRPTLIDFHGDAWFLGTPRESVPYFNTLYELGQQSVPGWKSWKLPSTDNPHIDAETEIAEALRAGTPEWLVQREYFAEMTEDDTGFFPRNMIDRCKRDWTREPLARGFLTCGIEDLFERESVVFNRRVDRLRWVDDPNGPWSFWQWWEGERPPQDHNAHGYAAGADLGWGVGASNTVFALADADTREPIAEYVNPFVTPEEAALQASMMMLWMGGRPGAQVPLLNFESNGPGENFTTRMKSLRYGNLFREKHVPSAVDSDDPGRVGWRSGPTSKRILLDEFRAALATGRYPCPSVAALDECLTYHQDGKGRILSEREWLGEDTEDLARAPHGDRVIAHALCWAALQAVGRQKPPVLPPIPGTLSGYMAAEAEKKRKQARW